MTVGGAGAKIISASAGRVVVNLLQPAGDLISTYGSGAKLYLQRDTTSAFAAPSSVGSGTALVANTEQIEIVDASMASTSYYRARIGDSGGATTLSDWSDVLMTGELTAYASLDELVAEMSVPAGDTKVRNKLAQLLIDASDRMTKECSRDFYRHPHVSSTETRYFHVKRGGERSLVRAIRQSLDLVSITSLYIASNTGGTYTEITAGSTGYYLEPQNPLPDEPYTDVLLASTSTSFATYPTGEQIVKIIGVFGRSAIPQLVKRATLDLARDWYRSGPGGGGPIGVSALGQPVFGPGTPASVYAAIRAYRRDDYSYV